MNWASLVACISPNISEDHVCFVDLHSKCPGDEVLRTLFLILKSVRYENIGEKCSVHKQVCRGKTCPFLNIIII